MPSKPMATSYDLSLAYSPGVAEPCLEIAKDNELAYTYTNKANLVAIVSDGSAVLGLGNIGAQASKPVMEGKACLFKKFANVNAYDIEINVHSIEEIVNFCKALAPTVGGINLEDIAAPKCFEIEAALQDLGIPVMHDDQHGTAIISTAGLMNAMEISGKKFKDIKVVVSGAGAAGIASAKMYRNLGVENIILVDSKGNNDGVYAGDGEYTVKMVYNNKNGEKITANYGTYPIEGVVFKDGVAYAKMAGQEVPFDAIQEITDYKLGSSSSTGGSGSSGDSSGGSSDGDSSGSGSTEDGDKEEKA